MSRSYALRRARTRQLLLACAYTCAFGALLGCGPEHQTPRIICHNANCVEPANPDEDDTVASLTASLKLVDEADRPLIDGLEIDTFWDGARERCLFAHDLNDPDSATDAPVATGLINAHLDARGQRPLTRQGGPFAVFIELKGHVGPSKAEVHSPEQRRSHAACALALASELERAAQARDRPVEVSFTSFDPALLQALVSDQAWPALAASPWASLKLGLLVGIPKPLDSQTKPLSSVPPELKLDMVSAHPHWVQRATLAAIGASGWELNLWMFSAVPETYDAIRRYEPQSITTSEARTLAGWLDQRW